MPWKQTGRGFLFSSMLYFACFFGTLVFLTPCLPVAVVWPRIGRRMMDFFLWLWFVLAASLIEQLLGVKMLIYGDPVPSPRSALILCNHRTRLDWLFMMSYQLRCGLLDQFRISLKSSLKSIPGPGWAMQCAGFLFLNRNWLKDKDRISQALEYFASSSSYPQVLLFPEGTDMCVKSLSRSKIYAEKNGMPVYKYVLHPRSTGFIHFVTTMRKAKILDSVVDITVAYPKDIIQSETDLGLGKAPQEVHISVQHFPASDLPQSSEKLEDWCRKIWHKKESTLEKFYENKTFSADGQTLLTSQAQEKNIKILQYLVIGFWSTFLLLVGYALVFNPLFRWYCLLSTLLLVFIDRFYDGVDTILYSLKG